MITDKTTIDGCFAFRFPRHNDKRGYFTRVFNKDDNIRIFHIDFDLKQASVAYNEKARTARGLHYQRDPFGENKIVNCLSGSAHIIVVDLRENSRTYMSSLIRKIESRTGGNDSIYIPSGCALGYVTLEDNTMLLYHMDEYYYPQHQCTINFLNKDLNLDYDFDGVIISDKDKEAA